MSKASISGWTTTDVSIPPLVYYKNLDGSGEWESEEVQILLKDGTEVIGCFNSSVKNGWESWGVYHYKKNQVKAWKKL